MGITVAKHIFSRYEICNGEIFQRSRKTKKTEFHWNLGSNFGVSFFSDVNFSLTRKDIVKLSGSLPGFSIAKSESSQNVQLSKFTFNHVYSDDKKDSRLVQNDNEITIVSSWKENLPADFFHLLYGIFRFEMLKRKIFSVHSACIGKEKEEFVLLVGGFGAGKTSIQLNSVLKEGMKVFSAGKTPLRFKKDGRIEAISGTRTISIRKYDFNRWKKIQKKNEFSYNDRLAFQLENSCYFNDGFVVIKKIFLIGLNDGVKICNKLTPLSALHTLYPFFLDKHREDVLIGGSCSLYDGSIEKSIKKYLMEKLETSLSKIDVYKVVGDLKYVTNIVCQ